MSGRSIRYTKCVISVLKLFLCILILFCSAVIGLHLSQQLKRRLDVLLDFEQLLHHASIKIEYTKGDLCEVFSDNFARFDFRRDVSFEEQWKRFVERFSGFMKEDDIKLMLEFTDGLGAADIDSQQKHLALYVKLLQEHIDNARVNIEKRSKMYRIMPLSLGMAVSLLII